MEFLTGLGYSIITLAIIIGIGVVLILQFASTASDCPTGYLYQQNSTGYTYTTGLCCNASSSLCGTGNSTSPSAATTQLNVVQGYLGTGTGGLATWIPLVIIAVIGMWFLGAFLTRRGRNKV